MAAQTFTTDTKTVSMRLIKWLFISSGLLVVLAQSYNVIFATDPNYLNLLTGACFLFMGLFFDVYCKNISITIGEDGIQYRRFKTGIMPEQKQQSEWTDIKKVILNNSSIRVVERNTTNKRFQLPHYTNDQFQNMKDQLHELTEENGAVLEVKSWW